MLSLVVVFVVCRSSGEAASNTIQARRRRAAAVAHADEGTHTHHLSARRLKAVLISFSSSVACGAEGGERERERVVGRGEMGDRAPPPPRNSELRRSSDHQPSAVSPTTITSISRISNASSRVIFMVGGRV